MDEKQIMAFIKSMNKPYQGVMPQSSFSSIMTRYEAGLTKPKTIINFLIKLGFKMEGQSWSKK